MGVNKMNYMSIVCDPNNLYEAYTKTIKSSRWKETTQKFALNYLRNIFDLSNKLYARTYIPKQEGEFTLIERGKIRPITTLHPRDRTVRHVICDTILIPGIKRKLIYDNGSSIKGKGVSFARKRFEVHLHKGFERYGTNEFYGLFVDFSKFYDNIIHKIAKDQLLSLCDHDDFMGWILEVIFQNFQVDVSYMNDEEYKSCMETLFDKNKHRLVQKDCLTKEKMMEKSINIGDPVSQPIGMFYPNRIDTYIKFVRSMKLYGRFVDDFYIFSDSKDELKEIFFEICRISNELGIHINRKKTKIVRMDKWNRFLQIRYRVTETGKVLKQINPKRVTSMRRRMKKHYKKFEEGSMTYEQIEQSFKSWMCAFYKIMSKSQRKSIIQLFENLFNKTVEIRKVTGKWKMIIAERR